MGETGRAVAEAVRLADCPFACSAWASCQRGVQPDMIRARRWVALWGALVSALAASALWFASVAVLRQRLGLGCYRYVTRVDVVSWYSISWTDTYDEWIVKMDPADVGTLLYGHTCEKTVSNRPGKLYRSETGAHRVVYSQTPANDRHA